MNRLHTVIVAVACSLAAGCRQDPYLNAHVEILNAEKRSLEDRVYELEYDFDLKVEELERLQAENQRLKDSGGPPAAEASRADLEFAPPTIVIPDEDEMLDLTPPSVQPGIPAGPASNLPTPPGSAASTRPTVRLPDGDDSLVGDPRITHIQIDPQLTGGSNWDPRPGDDGIALVFQPRNQDDMYVPLAGPVSVVILDAAAQVEQMQVARWDLKATDVDRQIRNEPDEKGIFLKLAWPDQPPRHQNLQLFVRYVTVDGRNIEADQPIAVTSTGRLSSRWTPRSAPREGSEPSDERPLNVARPEWKPFR